VRLGFLIWNFETLFVFDFGFDRIRISDCISFEFFGLRASRFVLEIFDFVLERYYDRAGSHWSRTRSGHFVLEIFDFVLEILRGSGLALVADSIWAVSHKGVSRGQLQDDR
jgi:hypothetical protein